MQWWTQALIVSIVWIALTIGVGMLHTDVVLRGKITPAQDSAISGRYGTVCAIGLIVIWVVYSIRNR